MGGAFVATANDASAMFWNPAGLTGIEGAHVHFSHTQWWATLKLNHAALAYTAEELGSFGVSMTVLSMDKMEITTELEPEGTGQFFDAQDVMLGVSYARHLTSDFSVGITAKYVSQRIWNETAGGVAFDIGTRYALGFRDLTLAMSMTNLGPDLRYDGRDLSRRYDENSQVSYNRLSPARLATEDYSLPLHFQVGLAITPFSTDGLSVRVAADVTHPNDNNERVNVGTEIRVLEHFSVRGGYRFGYDIETATFGAGVAVPVGTSSLTFDYAYALYDLLPDISRFSIGLSF
jgi:hypothetical protein